MIIVLLIRIFNIINHSNSNNRNDIYYEEQLGIEGDFRSPLKKEFSKEVVPSERIEKPNIQLSTEADKEKEVDHNLDSFWETIVFTGQTAGAKRERAAENSNLLSVS